ncbi:MAG TPA: acyl-CoA dehydrogenase family protein [Candidatus Micrarchaeaceae archaeon]|nr:acyl-CoA dehydrogenase family protein [Candidatus Micrarchaeaceae archaeon]
MKLQFTPEQEAWRAEVVAFLEQEANPSFIAEVEKEDAASSFANKEFSQKLAAKGWLTLHWPKQFGGQERPMIDLFILNEQLGRFHAPVGFHNIATEWVALPLMEFGTEEQKERFLGPIARADVSYSPNLSESEAGSDLANISMRAVRDGDEYVLNGIKTWITPAHRSDYLWTLTVTNPDSPKRHEGFSMFIVDVKSPGIGVVGIPTINHGRINSVYFDAVRVPASNLVGGENGGWRVAMSTLNIERSGIYYVAANLSILSGLIEFAKTTRRGNGLLIDRPLVRRGLATWAAELEAQRMLSYRVAWLQAKGVKPSVEPSVQSLRVRMYEHAFADFAINLLGLRGQVRRESRWAALHGRIERIYLASCSQHAGGTTEVQKNVVAVRGLALPRA